MPERLLERLIFASRWLMAPFYLGLIVALALLAAAFLRELAGLAPRVLDLKTTDVLLAALSLVDLTLAASLVLMIVFSGYENFVSKIDTARTRDWPEWMAKIDFTGLKLKLMSSVVAISAIQLLKIFMDLKNTSDRDIGWAVGLHVVFVISGLVFALTDRLGGEGGHAKAKAEPHL